MLNFISFLFNFQFYHLSARCNLVLKNIFKFKSLAGGGDQIKIPYPCTPPRSTFPLTLHTLAQKPMPSSAKIELQAQLKARLEEPGAPLLRFSPCHQFSPSLPSLPLPPNSKKYLLRRQLRQFSPTLHCTPSTLKRINDHN